jgi:type 1 fimbriae regulatory protein FimB/type 1 fimbriae regulatory protein FimE
MKARLAEWGATALPGSPADFGKLPFQISSHVLRHSCGYKLANDGRDTRSIQHYLGHRSIASTVRYTALALDRFKDFWR